MQPLVSVIIPTFQRPELINCLKALTHQTTPSDLYEIVIVSDGPNEQTKKLVNHFTNNKVRIRYFSLPKHRGPAAARNLGWRRARGTIIGFTDDDTVPDKNWLKTALKEFEEGAKALSGKVIIPLPKIPTHYEKTVAFIEDAEFVTANCFCLKPILRKVKGFDERFDIAWREDSDLQFKLIENNIPIKKTESLIVTHSPKKFNWSNSLINERKNQYDALLFKKHRQLFWERIPKYRGLLILYYTITVTFIAAILTRSQSFILFFVFLSTALITKRLWRTSYSLATVTEVILTSFLIPFLSVFWRLYGAVKYKVFFF